MASETGLLRMKYSDTRAPNEKGFGLTMLEPTGDDFPLGDL